MRGSSLIGCLGWRAFLSGIVGQLLIGISFSFLGDLFVEVYVDLLDGRGLAFWDGRLRPLSLLVYSNGVTLGLGLEGRSLW